MEVLISKTGENVQVDFDNLPEQSKAFVIAYGLRQKLNDCHASLKEADFDNRDDYLAAVADRVNTVLSHLMDGTITERTGGYGSAVDPVTAMARRIANTAIRRAIKAQGKKVKDFSAEAIKAKVIALAETEEYQSQAKAQLAEQAKIGKKVNIDDLL